jgi:molybdopterin-binding protein
MNKLHAIISTIKEHESLYLIELDASGITLSMLLFDLNPVFSAGSKVSVLFKETEVMLAKNLTGEISINNLFKATVTEIRAGSLLANVSLHSLAGNMVSIITMDALERLGLKNNDEITVLIKASQISLEAHRDD